MKTTQNIVICSNFTIEPIEQAFNFWLKQLNWPHEIKFAPYNQVFQELFNPNSLFSVNKKGINLLFIRFEDWQHYHLTKKSTTLDMKQVESNVSELKEALKVYSEAGYPSTWILFCPPSRAFLCDEDIKKELTDYELEISNECKQYKDIHCVTSLEITKMYPIDSYENAETNSLAHIPFNNAFYTILATLSARKLSKLWRPVYKVIAVDCDNTLWKGVCGEVGALGVEISPPFHYLQEFLIQQAQQGMLICLCSKNDEEDVFLVFRENKNMILKREQITTWRINWENKSQNLSEMAKELQLGIESFIFLDDNPIECAEVQAHIPGVLTLQLPTDIEKIPHFLNHTWAFDAGIVTDEDKQRTQMYQQNIERERVRTTSSDFSGFFASLNLQIQIEAMQTEQLDRVSQLTQRTNQFNATTIRRTSSEIQSFTATPQHHCLTVQVSDRFGEYGLVGVVLYNIQSSSLIVDTFLLSCRVLGRGVEHRMIAELGKIAIDSGCNWVEIVTNATPKNQPVRDFVLKIARQYSEKDNIHFKLPSDYAKNLDWNPAQVTQEEINQASEVVEKKHSQIKDETNYNLGVEYADPRKIIALLQSKKHERLTTNKEFIAPRNDIEQLLANIWIELLKVDAVSVNDDFFDQGGESMTIVQMISEAREHGLKFTMQEVIEYPVLEDLAKKIEKNNYEETSLVADFQDEKKWTLSHAQFVYWLNSLLNGDTNGPTIVSRVKLVGRLDIVALTQAFYDLFKTHEILTYHFPRFQPLQYPQHQIEFTINEENLEALSEVQKEEYLLLSEAKLVNYHSWDKGKPLLKVILYNLDASNSELQVAVPHIIADELSMKILMHHLSDYYLNIKSNTKENNKKHILPFKNYIQYEKNTSANNNNYFEFWKSHLNNVNPYFNFPPDEVMSDIEGKSTLATTLEIDEKILENLQIFCKNNKINMSDFIVAAIGLILVPYSANSATAENNNTIIALLKSNRNMGANYEETIGPFAEADFLKVNVSQKDIIILTRQIAEDRKKAEQWQAFSPFCKFAALDFSVARKRHKSLCFLLDRLAWPLSKMLSNLLQHAELMMKGCSGLFLNTKEKGKFLVYLNIQNNFVITSKNKSKELFGFKQHKIPFKAPDGIATKSALEIRFTRDDAQDKAYLYISGNLNPASREKIANDLIGRLRDVSE